MFERKSGRIYLGAVRNGVVIFSGDAKPAEGMRVLVNMVGTRDADGLTVGQRLLKQAGTVTAGYPADASTNLDYYLDGHPKE